MHFTVQVRPNDLGTNVAKMKRGEPLEAAVVRIKQLVDHTSRELGSVKVPIVEQRTVGIDEALVIEKHLRRIQRT